MDVFFSMITLRITQKLIDSRNDLVSVMDLGAEFSGSTADVH